MTDITYSEQSANFARALGSAQGYLRMLNYTASNAVEALVDIENKGEVKVDSFEYRQLQAFVRDLASTLADATNTVQAYSEGKERPV